MSKFSKIFVNFYMIFSLLNLVNHVFFPYILGQDIDREYIKNIDTEEITEFYRENPDAGGYIEKTGAIVDYLFYDDEKNEVGIRVEIYPENKYKEKADIKVNWVRTKTLFSYGSVVKIKKNNVFIRIIDDTKTIRSKVGMEKLKELLAEIGL